MLPISLVATDVKQNYIRISIVTIFRFARSHNLPPEADGNASSPSSCRAGYVLTNGRHSAECVWSKIIDVRSGPLQYFGDRCTGAGARDSKIDPALNGIIANALSILI